MESAKKTRSILLIVMILVAVSVVLFGRQSPRRYGRSSGAARPEGTLLLRSGLTLSMQDRDAWQTANAPIPDAGQPIDWSAVQASRRQAVPDSPSGWQAPRDMNRAHHVDAVRNPATAPTRIPRSIDARYSRDGAVALPTSDQAVESHTIKNQTPTPTAATVRPQTIHRIVEGETLRDIAARHLGSPDRYLELFYANRSVLPHPDVLPLGARLVIPDQDISLSREGGIPPAAPFVDDWGPAAPSSKGIRLPEN